MSFTHYEPSASCNAVSEVRNFEKAPEPSIWLVKMIGFGLLTQLKVTNWNLEDLDWNMEHMQKSRRGQRTEQQRPN